MAGQHLLCVAPLVATGATAQIALRMCMLTDSLVNNGDTWFIVAHCSMIVQLVQQMRHICQTNTAATLMYLSLKLNSHFVQNPNCCA